MATLTGPISTATGAPYTGAAYFVSHPNVARLTAAGLLAADTVRAEVVAGALTLVMGAGTYAVGLVGTQPFFIEVPDDAGTYALHTLVVAGTSPVPTIEMGIPRGGNVGDIFRKTGPADFAAGWVPPAEVESGGVTSVNERSGAVTLTKSDVGLGNADNTSDADKPVSTATATALSGKADTSHTHAEGDVTGLTAALAAKAALASPALTGTPTAPTALADTNTTQIATTAFAKGEADAAQAAAIAASAPVSHTHA
ncbi:MAG: hypothetical protein ACYDC1_11995, partial [Limisphaerales bacterium]